MNRTDRLLAIMLELQRRKQIRAEDLAESFEVSVRTIYRDMQALSEAGVPLVAITGQGYSLMEGYFLPPLNFTGEEALMLVLGSDFVRQNFDAQYRDASQSASQKIEAVLPESLRDEVNYLRQNITFFTMRTLDDVQHEQLRQLRRAVMARQTVRIHYSKRIRDGDELPPTVRDIDPYSLSHLNNDWYVMARCHLREGLRIFKLARIDQLHLTDKTFIRPRDFVPDWIGDGRRRQVEVKVVFAPQVIRWAREILPYSVVAEDETDNGVVITLRVEDEREVVQWLLGWGAGVRVIEPESLKQRLIDEAQRLIDGYA